MLPVGLVNITYMRLARSPFAAMLSPAPGRFSTTAAEANDSANFCATSRAIVSAALPAAVGETMVMAFARG